jgi:hypothetical protein
LSEDEARWKARREFGNVRAAQERFYLKGRLVWLDSLLQDLRLALRQMRRSPGFTLTAVLTLGLGIAANVIVFGVLQAMVLRSLDVPHADRVMTLGSTGMAFPVLSYPEVRDVRDESTVFSAVAADEVQNFGLEANGITRPVWGYEVSGQYFEVVGIKPLLGRLLQRSDDDLRAPQRRRCFRGRHGRITLARTLKWWERLSGLISIRTRLWGLHRKAFTGRKDFCSLIFLFRWRMRRRWKGSTGLRTGVIRTRLRLCGSKMG